jgi:hypothetical protein
MGAIIMSIDEITSWSTVLLTFITIIYVVLTHLILNDQKKSRQILAIEKKLENVFSPLDEAVNTLLLNKQMFNVVDIDQIYNLFNGKLESVRKNYGYIVFTDTELQEHDREIVNSWNDFKASRNEKNLADFKSSIERFQGRTTKVISDYNEKLKNL